MDRRVLSPEEISALKIVRTLYDVFSRHKIPCRRPGRRIELLDGEKVTDAFGYLRDGLIFRGKVHLLHCTVGQCRLLRLWRRLHGLAFIAAAGAAHRDDCCCEQEFYFHNQAGVLVVSGNVACISEVRVAPPNSIIWNKLTLSFDVFCRKETKSEYLVPSRFYSDFAGMMRPGHDQSTPFGLSAAG